MTLHLVLLCLMPPILAFVHRLRGGGFFTMPFKGTYVLWIVPGLLAGFATMSWKLGLVWGIGYLVWILPGWMKVITDAEGAETNGQVMSETWDVRLVEDIDGGDAIIGCYVRAALFLAPLALGLAVCSAPWYPLAFIVGLFWPAYAVAYRTSPLNQSAIAEPLVGLSWGCAMVASIVLMGGT